MSTPEARRQYKRTYRAKHTKAYRAERARSRLNARAKPSTDDEHRRRIAQAMIRRIRHRCKKAGIEFRLKLSDIHIPECCPVLGHRFILDAIGYRDEYSPSLDRIDRTLGYLPGNVIVVSCRVNRIKNDSTLDELVAIASFYTALADLAN